MIISDSDNESRTDKIKGDKSLMKSDEKYDNQARQSSLDLGCEVERNINDLETESQKIVEYNNSKDSDIKYLESILTLNMYLNNQMKGTIFLYDQRMAVKPRLVEAKSTSNHPPVTDMIKATIKSSQVRTGMNGPFLRCVLGHDVDKLNVVHWAALKDSQDGPHCLWAPMGGRGAEQELPIRDLQKWYIL